MYAKFKGKMFNRRQTMINTKIYIKALSVEQELRFELHLEEWAEVTPVQDIRKQSCCPETSGGPPL